MLLHPATVVSDNMRDSNSGEVKRLDERRFKAGFPVVYSTGIIPLINIFEEILWRTKMSI